MKIKEEYNKKYTELSLTGNIPQNPKYLYEYELPKDFETPLGILSYSNEQYIMQDKTFEICLNSANKLVLNANETPLVFCYKPKPDTEEIPKNTFNNLSLFGLSDLGRKVATKLATLREANIEPQNITFNWEVFKALKVQNQKSITFQDIPVCFSSTQTEDFLIGV